MRYNAEIKHFPGLLDFFKQHFQLLAVCPEVEMGLSVPRPPVQLVQQDDNIKMLGRDDPSLDVTPLMQAYCNDKLPQLNSIHGYVFKSRSPSCGVTDTPLFKPDGEQITLGRGLFVEALLQQYPQLPITDELALQTTQQQQAFLKQVLSHQLNQL